LVAAAVLILLPVMARAQDQESAPPPSNLERLNNFHREDVVDEDDHECGDRATFFLHNTAGCLERIEHGHDISGCLDATTVGVEPNTLLVGLSTRLALTSGMCLMGPWTPRASGFRPGVSLKTFGIEKRLRGHVFQLNVSNSLGTTVSEMARGASNDRDWFLGFNISRKFF
jgi:hypothetical protein